MNAKLNMLMINFNGHGHAIVEDHGHYPMYGENTRRVGQIAALKNLSLKQIGSIVDLTSRPDFWAYDGDALRFITKEQEAALIAANMPAPKAAPKADDYFNLYRADEDELTARY